MRFIAISLAFILASLQPVSAKGCDVDEASPVLTLIMVTYTPNDPWMTGVVRFARAAAVSYGFRFEVLNLSPEEAAGMAALETHVAEYQPKAAVVVTQMTYAAQLVRYLDSEGVFTGFAITPLSDVNYALTGNPKQKYPYYVVHVVPDDERAGYDLANILLDEARRRDIEPPIRIVGISGEGINPVSIARSKGLRRAVEEASDAELIQIAYANWSPIVAAQKARMMSIRYGKVDVLWAANDTMALAAMDMIDRREGVVVGGYDWTDPARKLMEEGYYAASLGGHNADVALAIGILVDHVLKRAAPRRPSESQFVSALSPLRRENIVQYERLLNELDNCETDFPAAFGVPVIVPEGGLETASLLMGRE
ncbi:substrate-binding domain-containing protein [Parvularcula sp. LCG005]|uniref:substrate-binding domain-containing protein n=1 Tax=Parvularcula sp. LCG005 TaxID=3078805 RepID=UPI002942EA6F|nr:substrate-binding domain-containing protein [Parvularcula sp. LCG005]WOI53933.1 substrate-binding domain-containing protein [Parvularcula sp. LCG005]